MAKPGTGCQPAGSNVRLWRADTQAASTYAIAAEGSEAATSVTFPAGEMLAGWGAGSAPAAGTAYRIGHGINTGPVEVRFVFLDQVPDAPEDLAASLISNGCMVQVEQMSAALLTTD